MRPRCVLLFVKFIFSMLVWTCLIVEIYTSGAISELFKPISPLLFSWFFIFCSLIGIFDQIISLTHSFFALNKGLLMVAIMLGIVFAPFVSVPAYWLAMLINSCGRKQGRPRSRSLLTSRLKHMKHKKQQNKARTRAPTIHRSCSLI